MLRILFDFNKAINENIEYEMPQVDYYIKDFDNSDRVKNLILNKDNNIFNKAIEIISEIYEKEFIFILANTKYSVYRPFDIITMIVSTPDKYKWTTKFNEIFED